jgi:hypothetical protein
VSVHMPVYIAENRPLCYPQPSYFLLPADQWKVYN